ncbi:MAG: IclR family transcriptional regulator [Rhizobiaceae bacterium]|nr:IclR family transcriptional regulator [Hyphomicrobiales bacterium]NRB30275.1 IclR family transcriptional regulator [Rhizobiaceae bacterium]
MKSDERVATNLRTLLILEAVAASDRPLSPTEINRDIGLPKQSIHRLCQTLVEEGFLIREVSGKKLEAAPRTLRMARGLTTSRHLNIARHQVLTSISAATKETVNFVVPEFDGMTYLDRVETDWIFRIELPIGSRVPFHCTASGKCYLASLDAKQFNDVVGTIRFEPRTPNTITSKEQLQSEIQVIRERGYAIDNEELFRDMCALAVPVNDSDGKFLAALAYHGPTQRLNVETLVDHLETMREGAAKLAELMR